MIIIILLLSFFTNATFADEPKVQNFLFLGGDSEDLIRLKQTINKFDGVQIVYTWKSLESTQDTYTFEQIESNLQFLNSLNKKLFIQIQDRFFEPDAKNIPSYILNEAIYNGGLVSQLDNPGENKAKIEGWVTQQWNDSVRERYQKLIKALANQFDGRVYGINLPETAIDIDIQSDNTDFTCDKYFDAVLDNIQFTRKAFIHSYVVQYTNFFPCEWNNDHNYMGRLFKYAQDNKIGLGGPDIIPYKQAYIKDGAVYNFFNQYKGKLNVVAMAVQEPTLTYTNPKTNKKFTQKEFTDFAVNFLGTNIIFWTPDILK